MSKRSRASRKRAQTSARKLPIQVWLGAAGAVVLVVVALAIAASFGERNRALNPTTRASRPRLQIPAEPSPSELESVPRITALEAQQLFAEGRAVVIDVRDIESYRAGHVPGALQIPLGYVVGELPHFARDRRLIAYCT